MRLPALVCLSCTILGAACASAPEAGALGEGSSRQPKITAVDSGYPPRSISVQLDQPAYAAVVLVAPGHSATLLYPSDSSTNNQLTAGAHVLPFSIPSTLAPTDTGLFRTPRRADTTFRAPPRTRSRTSPALMPLPPTTRTYMLLVTSPQELDYGRMIEKTGGVSIPLVETEALNAVGKAIKSTIQTEPREWAGTFKEVELRRP